MEFKDKIVGASLYIGDTEYIIVETELYATEDPYTHRDPQQQRKETFYFHRMHGKGFKEGTFRGLDITFGDGKEFCAYLIRSIKNKETREVTEGPCLVVNTILRHFGAPSVKEFHVQYTGRNPDLSINNNESGLYCTLTDAPVPHSASPRVGLRFKKIPGYDLAAVLRYCMGPYRFVVNGTPIKKQSNTLRYKPTSTEANIIRGQALTPEEALQETADWKVADMAKCYGAYCALCAGDA